MILSTDHLTNSLASRTVYRSNLLWWRASQFYSSVYPMRYNLGLDLLPEWCHLSWSFCLCLLIYAPFHRRGLIYGTGTECRGGRECLIAMLLYKTPPNVHNILRLGYHRSTRLDADANRCLWDDLVCASPAGEEQRQIEMMKSGGRNWLFDDLVVIWSVWCHRINRNHERICKCLVLLLFLRTGAISRKVSLWLVICALDWVVVVRRRIAPYTRHAMFVRRLLRLLVCLLMR